jgi:hypothetical protein
MADDVPSNSAGLDQIIAGGGKPTTTGTIVRELPWGDHKQLAAFVPQPDGNYKQVSLVDVLPNDPSPLKTIEIEGVPYLVRQKPDGTVSVEALNGGPDISKMIDAKLNLTNAQIGSANASATANTAQAGYYNAQTQDANNKLSGGILGFDMMRQQLRQFVDQGSLTPEVATQILSRVADSLVTGISQEKRMDIENQRTDKMLGAFQNAMTQFQGIAKSGVPDAGMGFLGALSLQSRLMGGPQYSSPEEFSANIGNSFAPPSIAPPLQLGQNVLGGAPISSQPAAPLAQQELPPRSMAKLNAAVATGNPEALSNAVDEITIELGTGNMSSSYTPPPMSDSNAARNWNAPVTSSMGGTPVPRGTPAPFPGLTVTVPPVSLQQLTSQYGGQ